MQRTKTVTLLYLFSLCPFEPCKIAVCDKIVLALYLENISRGLDETLYNFKATEDDVESTRTIIVVCTVLELGPFKTSNGRDRVF